MCGTSTLGLVAHARFGSVDGSSLLDGRLVGLSTGAEAAWRRDDALGIADCLSVFPEAIELSVSSEPRLPRLLDYLERSPDVCAGLAEMAHVSLHGPIKRLSGDWPAVVRQIERLPAFVTPVVFHPDTLDASARAALAELGSQAALENMDCRKSDGRYPAELAALYQALPEARFVLDVAHVWTLDPTLELGFQLLECYGDRLSHLHVSGIEADGQHRPTLPSDLERYAPLLERCRDLVWVLETQLTDT